MNASLGVVVEVVCDPRLGPDLDPVRRPQPVLYLVHPQVERLLGAEAAVGAAVVDLTELVPVGSDVRPVLEREILKEQLLFWFVLMKTKKVLPRQGRVVQMNFPPEIEVSCISLIDGGFSLLLQ